MIQHLKIVDGVVSYPYNELKVVCVYIAPKKTLESGLTTQLPSQDKG